MPKLFEVSWHPGPFTVHASTEKEAKAIATEHLMHHMQAKEVQTLSEKCVEEKSE